MNNHYFGVNFNVFLFGKFSDTVNGPHKVDSGDTAKQSQGLKDGDYIKGVPKVG